MYIELVMHPTILSSLILFSSCLQSCQHRCIFLMSLHIQFSSVQSFSNVLLCDSMDCSTPGLSVLHYLLEFAQTCVHWVSDAIQSPYSLAPASPPALNISQHQGLFQWVRSLHQVAKVNIGASALASVLPMNIQGWFLLGLTGFVFLLSKGLSRVFSSPIIWKH